MKRPTNRILLLFTCSFLSFNLLTAQDTTRTAIRRVDQGTQMMVERIGLDQSLIFNGGFVVNNPDLDYEIEEDKLYLDPLLQPYVITLVGGLTDTLLARIQLLDQQLEVDFEGRELQIDRRKLESVTTPDGRLFVSFRQPVVFNDPPPLLELLGTYENQKLYAYRRVELRSPSHQRTGYDAGNYKKRLHREDLLYLISPAGTTPIKKLKDIIEALPEEQQQAATQYAKEANLRNREADYASLLSHLAGSGERQ